MFPTKPIYRAAAVFMIMLFPGAQKFPAYGQLGFVGSARGVITVQRSVTLPPDEAEFLIGVTTGLDVSQQTVLDALRGIGISVANLTVSRVGESAYDFRGPGSSSPSTLWNFQFDLIVPFERAADVRKKLEEWRQKPPEQLTALTYSWRPNASQKVVTEAQARLLPDMIAEGKRKADALAAEVGRTSSGLLESLSDPAPLLVSAWFAIADGFFPLSGSSFRGDGTELKFSLGFKFAKE